MRLLAKYSLLVLAVLFSVSFREPSGKHEVSLSSDVVYAHASGYWSELAVKKHDRGKLFGQGYLKSFSKRDLDLKLDLYRPEGAEGVRPMILFIHGGAFYMGQKDEAAYVDFCRHFASLGYVCASIDYRLGFHLNRNDIRRAADDALQDAHSALCFLVDHSAEYGIDPRRIFIAGSSAGAITALKLAFTPDRPEDGSYSILAVASLWGGVNDLSMLENSRCSIVSFHGDQDAVVPFAMGYPMTDLGEGISKMFQDRMYGSVCIDKKAEELGLRHKFYPFPGEGHALNVDEDKRPNANHAVIRDRMAEFFEEELTIASSD